MNKWVRNGSGLAVAAALLAGISLSTPAVAQRDPAYQAARSEGLIGEQPDGYLGIVGTPTPQLERVVNDINLRRRAHYTQEAARLQATVEQFAFTTACNLIQNLDAGLRYRAPNGTWMTRDATPPVRDSRCI
ncbi:YdbL family protein [Sphingomonas lacunae]|uniref:YdbL family protein n=1 Tax=Sphingomonas lacunae TaxID=2698828 RepID=A0A6M4AUU3_9SPHN|nr:YdbL family protein [Sphingomonas lacunae]QJQ32853.1 YdbL family protein [Sphingomonas lacunae]